MFPTKWQDDLEEVAAAEAAKGWVAPGPDTIEGAYTSEHDGSGRLLPIGIRKPVAGRADAPAQDPVLWPQNQTEAPKPSPVVDLDPEMTAASDSDRNLRLGADIEKIGRIWSGGDAMVRPADAVSRLMAAREKARKDALETKKASNAEMQLTGFLGGQAERARHDAAMLKIAQDKEAREVEAARVAAELKKEEGKRDDRKLGQGDRDLDIRESEAKAKAAAKAKEHLKTLPASNVVSLAQLPTALVQLDALEQKFKQLNMSSTGAKWGAAGTKLLGLQGTDAAKFNAEKKTTAQGVGTIIEGGKLAAGDEPKYDEMLPRPGDSDEVVATKMRSIRRLMRNSILNQLEGFEKGGYDVEELRKDAQSKMSKYRDDEDAARAPSVAPGMVEVIDGETGQPVTISKAAADKLLKAGKVRAK